MELISDHERKGCKERRVDGEAEDTLKERQAVEKRRKAEGGGGRRREEEGGGGRRREEEGGGGRRREEGEEETYFC